MVKFLTLAESSEKEATRKAIWAAKPALSTAKIAASGLTGSARQVAWAVTIRRKSGAPADVVERETTAQYWIDNRDGFAWRKGIKVLLVADAGELPF